MENEGRSAALRAPRSNAPTPQPHPNRCGGQFFNGFFGTWDQATNLTSHSKSMEWAPSRRADAASKGQLGN
jgi:hypothetical protein